MRIRTFLSLLAPAALLLAAAGPAGFQYWSAGELKAFDQKLSNGKPVNTQRLVDYDNHYTMVAHREGNGEAEWHEHEADFLIGQTGSATLIVGGQMPGAKTTAAGEMRGPSIEGGSKQTISAGDIVHVPARTPHQMLLNPGTKFTYFVIKVKGQ